jgi:hypothetical protein
MAEPTEKDRELAREIARLVFDRTKTADDAAALIAAHVAEAVKEKEAENEALRQRVETLEGALSAIRDGDKQKLKEAAIRGGYKSDLLDAFRHTQSLMAAAAMAVIPTEGFRKSSAALAPQEGE